MPVRVIRQIGYSARTGDNVEREVFIVEAGDCELDPRSAFEKAEDEYNGVDRRAVPINTFDQDISDIL